MVTLNLLGCPPGIKLEIDAVEPDDTLEDAGEPGSMEDTGEEREERPVDGVGDGWVGEEGCGMGVQLEEWCSDEPDGVYRNDGSDIGAAHYDQVFEIWVG